MLEEDAEDADAAADEDAEEAAAPCRACRINLSTTRNVSGSSMSTFSSTWCGRPVGRVHTHASVATRTESTERNERSQEQHRARVRAAQGGTRRSAQTKKSNSRTYLTTCWKYELMIHPANGNACTAGRERVQRRTTRTGTHTPSRLPANPAAGGETTDGLHSMGVVSPNRFLYVRGHEARGDVPCSTPFSVFSPRLLLAT